MPNQLAGNPLVLDGSSLGTVLINGHMKVEHFEFTGYQQLTTSKAILADRTGNIVWEATGAADGSEVRSAKVQWINGLQVLQQTDGLVLVFFE